MNLQQVAGALTQIKEQLAKARGEIVGKIDALQAALVDVQLPDDAALALDQLRATAQALDDIVPDAPADPDAPVQ